MPEPPPLPSARPDAAGPDANRAIFSEYGFPGAPDLTHLCAQRVYQPGGQHLTWDAFASDDAPATLVAHYKDWLGARGFEAKGAGGLWRVPAGAPSPDRTLEIDAAGEPGPYKACDKQPAASDKSVIVISRR